MSSLHHIIPVSSVGELDVASFGEHRGLIFFIFDHSSDYFAPIFYLWFLLPQSLQLSERMNGQINYFRTIPCLPRRGQVKWTEYNVGASSGHDFTVSMTRSISYASSALPRDAKASYEVGVCTSQIN